MVNVPIFPKNPVGYGFFPFKTIGGIYKLFPINTKKGPPMLKAVINI